MVLCLDMFEEFRKAHEGFNHLLVAIDKFTKWIEVWPIINPTNNGTQFIGRKFLDFYDSWLVWVE